MKLRIVNFGCQSTELCIYSSSKFFHTYKHSLFVHQAPARTRARTEKDSAGIGWIVKEAGFRAGAQQTRAFGEWWITDMMRDLKCDQPGNSHGHGDLDNYTYPIIN